MGFTGIGLDGEYIEKPEDKNDESEDEEVENESIIEESKESWNRWKPPCFFIHFKYVLSVLWRKPICHKNTLIECFACVWHICV